MARNLGARSEALSLRRWGQGGAGEGSTTACMAVNMNRLKKGLQSCAREGCSHDCAARSHSPAR